jgi:hypothetical protein
MSRDFPQPEWKILRELKPILLDRLCRRILDELIRLATADEGSDHKRYLEVYKHLRDRDKGIALAFDDMSRSTAIIRLAAIQSLGLLTPEELTRFSPETQQMLARCPDAGGP